MQKNRLGGYANMKKVYTVLFVMLLAWSITLTPLTFLIRSSYALSVPRIRLDPSESTFYANETNIGHRFNVTVWVENVTNLAGAQIFMHFSDSIVNVSRWFEPKSDPQYIFHGRSTSALPSPPNDAAFNRTGPETASVKVTVLLFPPPPDQPSFNGSGKICVLELKIVAKPSASGLLTSILRINRTDTFLLDSEGDEIPNVVKEDGAFTYVMPTRVYVEPPTNVFYADMTGLGHRFNVTVWVTNVTNLLGAQIHMEFNDTMVNCTRWFEPKNDTEYVFYGRETTALPTPPDPKYLHMGPGKGRVLVSLNPFPLEPPYFSGKGKLCILEFNITSANQAMSCPLSLHNSNTTDPKRTYLLDGNGAEIPIEILEDGSYTFIPELAPFVALSLLMASATVVLWFRKRLVARIGKI